MNSNNEHSLPSMGNAVRSHWSTPWLFSICPLLVGSMAAQIGISVPHTASPWHYPPLWPPLWVFWLVWIDIYPGWGFATYLVWQKRREADVRGALALFAIMFVSGLFFMPIASLSGDNPGVMTLGDLNGVVGSLIVAWVYTRYSRQSIWYLLPLLIWMPITFALKVFYWHANL